MTQLKRALKKRWDRTYKR